MPNTVESAFILLDRASGPIRQIRSELRGLQRDAITAGAAMDRVSNDRVARGLSNDARSMGQLRSETSSAGGELARTDQRLQRVNSTLDRHNTKVKEATLHWSALGKAVGLMKWPAIISGVGGLTQVVGGLTAGVVGLVPEVARMGGASAALIPTYAGVGAAMGVVKLATQGLSQAYRGNQRALAALTPEGRAALQMLRELHPELLRLQSTAQRGMMPGFANLLGGLRSDMPAIRQIVGQTAGDIGGIGTFFGQQFGGGTTTGQGNMRELVALADEGGRAVGSLARGAVYLAEALVHVGVAAGPMTDWLGTTIVHGAKALETEAKIAEETGRMQDFFGRAEQSVKLLWDTGRHALGGLLGVMHAASGESQSLWQSIDHVATRWDTWANSVTGQTEMRRWFDDMRPVLHDTVVLLGDAVAAIGHLTQGTQGSSMLQSLDSALPSIERGVQTITQTFGPQVVGALSNVLTLMADVSGSGGALTLFVGALGTGVRLVDDLVRALGPVGPAVATALGVFGLERKIGLVKFLSAQWASVAVNARAAAGAEGAATAGGGGGPIFMGGGGAGAAAGGEEALLGAGAGVLGARAMLARGTAQAGETALASGLILPRGVSAATGAAEGAGLLSRLSGAARGADYLGLASKGLSAAGKFAWPLALLSAGMGFLGTQGNFGQRLQGAGSALTFGIVPTPITGAQRRTAGGQYASNIIGHLSNAGSLAAQRRTVGGLRQTIDLLPGNDALNQNTTDLHTATSLLQAELHRREMILHQSQVAADQALEAQSIRHAQALVTDFSTAFGILARAHGPQSAMDQTVDGVLTRMRRMKPAGAEVLGESMIAWARQQEQQNPRLKGAFDHLIAGIKGDFSDLHHHVAVVNGDIRTGSEQEWKQIGAAMVTQTEIAREGVAKGFTEIQRLAIGSLTSMGFSHAQALSYVQGVANVQSGAINQSTPRSAMHIGDPGSGRRRAMGGYVLPGTASAGDVVRMSDGGWGAPGELVLSSWQQAAVDHDLSLAGKPPLAMRLSDGRMHRARGGSVGGGFVPMPGTNFSYGQEPQIAGDLAQLANFLHTTVYGISGYRSPGHSVSVGGFANDPHTQGLAADIGIGSPTRGSASRLTPAMLARFGLWRPFYPQSAAEINHVQLLSGGARSAAAANLAGLGSMAGSLSMTAPTLMMGGAPGAMGNAALRGYTAGMTSLLNRAMGNATGGGGSITAMLAPGASGNAQSIGRAMMLAAGYPAAQWPYLRALWNQESGWNPWAVNPSSGAAGIPQALGHGHVFNLGDVRAQVAWGLNYIRGTYGSPGGAWQHERRFNWYGDGADMIVNRPTVFGAGERGPERVTITPQGRGSGGGVTVRPVIEAGAIVVYAGGDERRVRSVIREELHRFAAAIADEIDGGRATDTASVLA